MNRKLILRLLGAILSIEAISMIPSMLIALKNGDGDFPVLAWCFAGTFIVGTLIWFLVRPGRGTQLRMKEGFLVVGLGWLELSAVGALPFYFSGYYPSYVDALFEAVSGFTTTGATVLTKFEGFPRGIMFWRATTHWIGGMGVLVLTLALIPKLTGRTSHLVLAESPGPSLSKLVPHTGTTAKILYLIYMALTLMEFLALLLCGLSPYDAALHALSNAGTGGFSNYGASIAAFNSLAVEIVITVFMFLFGVNFALYYKFLIAGPKAKLTVFFRDEEFRWYAGIILAFILLLTIFNTDFYRGDFWTSLRYSSFQICTVFSTTGFCTGDFAAWSIQSRMLLFAGMFIGACAGSTAGGIKIVRIALLTKLFRRSIRATGHPRKVEVVRLDGKAVDERMVSNVVVFALIYVVLFLLGSFLLSLEGVGDEITSLSAALTCVSNIGPGFGLVTSSFTCYGVFGKLICCFLMLAGRLELLPMLMLLTRGAWTRS